MADLTILKRKTSSKPKTKNAKAESINLNEVSNLMEDTSSMKAPTKKERTKDLNFKVPVSFHKAFKKFAIVHDMSMKDLLEASFLYYQDQFKVK